jgi:hypothetical protein
LAALEVDNIDLVNLFNNVFSVNWRMTANKELGKAWKEDNVAYRKA